MTEKTLIQFDDFSFSYPDGTDVLKEISFSVEKGEFAVLIGPSGSGKSTLLKQMKPALSPKGIRSGELLFAGKAISLLTDEEQARRIGFVQQSPENQVVTDKVWHELAFGLESLGTDSAAIRRRVAEMASFFGIQEWFDKDVSQLSGGQKQILSLASVMVMQPELLILDEPTAQLDPIAAEDFLNVILKINRELGTTVIMTEQRLEDLFPAADSVYCLENGRIAGSGSPRQLAGELLKKKSPMFLSMPSPMRVWAAAGGDGEAPISAKEGNFWLGARKDIGSIPQMKEYSYGEEVLSCNNIWFRYKKDGKDVVKDLSLSVKKGEFLTVLGGNGVGKSTSLKILAGILKPYRGRVNVNGRIGFLPQNPQTMFVKDNVEEDLKELGTGEASVKRVIELCDLEGLLERHPYDLSGGEQQRAALAKVLLREPDILLLDEPTKGMDAEFKREFAGIIRRLTENGVTIVMISHDLDFCAENAHRCAMFFAGNIASDADPRSFFSGNSFYTTSANRMAKGILPEAVTAGDIIYALGEKESEDFTGGGEGPLEPAFSADDADKSAGRCEGGAGFQAGLNAGSGSQKNPARENVNAKPARKSLTRQAKAAVLMILLAIPLTLFAGFKFIDNSRYYFVILAVLIECMLPFLMVFEGRKPQPRELVLIAVICALNVAGRTVFSALPEFKPVVALTVISGAALGSETGFLIGALSMLVSNMVFGMGPWTPWQMFAMGLIGFIAGLLFRGEKTKGRRLALSIYGAAASILIYGGIMNPASALLWLHEINWKILVSYYISGFPMDCMRAAATAIFLWLGAEPMLRKLARIKSKYGLVS